MHSVSMQDDVAIGTWNRLEILRNTDIGQVVDGGELLEEILLPKRYMHPDLGPGDEIDVFLYCDSEDRIIATTEKPYGVVGDMLALEVMDVTPMGFFLDWGLPKDLLLPLREKKGHPQRGEFVVVKIVFDEKSRRLHATQKLSVSPDLPFPNFRPGDKVGALIASEGDLGWTVVVEGRYLGMLFFNEVFCELEPAEFGEAYVRQVRPNDGYIDLSLEPIGFKERIDPLRDRILAALQESESKSLPLHSKSKAEDIYEAFACSKKNFKKALGGLYKDEIIRIEAHGIELR